MRQRRSLRELTTVTGALVVTLALILNCGGSDDPATGPDEDNTPQGPVISSCTSIQYQGVSLTANACPAGAVGQNLYFTVGGQDACIKASCSAGCASDARLGNNVQQGNVRSCEWVAGQSHPDW